MRFVNPHPSPLPEEEGENQISLLEQLHPLLSIFTRLLRTSCASDPESQDLTVTEKQPTIDTDEIVDKKPQMQLYRRRCFNRSTGEI